MKDSWTVQFADGKFEYREHGLYTDVPDGEVVDGMEWVRKKGFHNIGDISEFPAWPIWLKGETSWEECCYVISIHGDFNMEVWIDNPLDVLLFESQYLSPLQARSVLCDPDGLKVKTG